MESLPPALLDFISMFRPLLRAEVFDSFTYLLCGLLIGEAKHGTVRASVFAPPEYQPQRLSDLFCCHKLSRQALMAQLTQGVLITLYGGGLPARLFWLADSTLTEKPFARRVASVGLFHRAKRIVGRAKHLQGHCYVFAAHVYQTAHKHWASALVGALLYVKGRSIPRLVGDLAQQLRLPAEVRHVWVVDRGIVSRPLVQSLDRLDQYTLGPVRLIIVVVPGLRLKPWYLLTTDLELTPLEAVQAYGGRQQIEVNFDEVKELGLGHYQGRSGEGVRRWPVFLCIAHAILKLLATQVLHI